VDAKAMARTSFGDELFKLEFASALIYKLQRKKPLKSNDQSSADSTSTEDSLTSHQLLVIWRYNDEYRICVRALLIKHSNVVIWDEDTLGKLHSMHIALCRDAGIIEDTWLLDDATVLMTTSKLEEENRTFEITISEATRKDGTMEPLWVPPNM
jgi:hypothetical protein